MVSRVFGGGAPVSFDGVGMGGEHTRNLIQSVQDELGERKGAISGGKKNGF